MIVMIFFLSLKNDATFELAAGAPEEPTGTATGGLEAGETTLEVLPAAPSI